MNNYDTRENEVETALEAGKTIAKLEAGNLESAAIAEQLGPYVVKADGSVVSAEHLLARPRRQRATVSVYDVDSFVRYIAAYAGASPVVFADPATATFRAVLDYHIPLGEARWWQHTATLTLTPTEAWRRWTLASGEHMDQWTFAQFLEDHVPDIAQPSGALVVEMARGLEAKKTVIFSSSVRAQDGQHRLIYDETINATTRQGELQIPESVTLGLAPFEGSARYRVEARLRFRIEKGTVQLWFDLLRPDLVAREAFDEARAAISAGLLTVPVYTGPAPMQKL